MRRVSLWHAAPNSRHVCTSRQARMSASRSGRASSALGCVRCDALGEPHNAQHAQHGQVEVEACILGQRREPNVDATWHGLSPRPGWTMSTCRYRFEFRGVQTSMPGARCSSQPGSSCHKSKPPGAIGPYILNPPVEVSFDHTLFSNLA